jgi:8-oxo-dGTP diphosphatase
MREPTTGATLRPNRSTDTGFGVDVNALAAIGRDQRLLAIRPRTGGQWFLPGAPVLFGEPIEDGLRRVLNDELGVSATFLTFLTAIEHYYTDRFGIAHHELDLIFDAGLASSRVRCADESLEHRWMSTADLADVEFAPRGLSEGLLSGRFDEGNRWLPWRRYENSLG